MRGVGELEAQHEIHIFLAPLNTDAETVQRYEEAVAEFNHRSGADSRTMKPCHLALVFRGDAGMENTVRVMQSAQYIYDNDMERVVTAAKVTAQYFRDCEFQVLRVKIEASAYGIEGIPQTSSHDFPGRYFEFHIAVRRTDAQVHGPLLDEELSALKQASRELSQKLGVPVPLSYNQNKEGTDEGHQRFLNVRFRGCGMTEIAPRIKEVTRAINETGVFTVRKVISEYVWYDTMPEMDKGWID